MQLRSGLLVVAWMGALAAAEPAPAVTPPGPVPAVTPPQPLPAVTPPGPAEPVAPERAGAASAAEAGQFAAWVRELGDDDFQTREQAQQKLLAAGRAAAAALREAADKGADPEIQLRAGMILKILTAKPRIEAAIQELGTDDPEKLAAALDTLCEEFDQGCGAEEAVARAATGAGPAADMARCVKVQLEQLVRGKQQFLANATPANRQYLQQYLRHMQENLLRVCKAILEKRTKDKRGKAPAEEKGAKNT